MGGVASELTRRGEWHEPEGSFIEGAWGNVRGNRAIRNDRLCYADGVGHEDAYGCRRQENTPPREHFPARVLVVV